MPLCAVIIPCFFPMGESIKQIFQIFKFDKGNQLQSALGLKSPDVLKIVKRYCCQLPNCGDFKIAKHIAHPFAKGKSAFQYNAVQLFIVFCHDNCNPRIKLFSSHPSTNWR